MILENLNFPIAHDPTIVKEDGVYYCFSTHGIILSSADLRNWKFAGKVFEHNFDWVKQVAPGCKDDLWAPEIVFRNGKWRLYYSVSSFGKRTSGIGLAENLTVNPLSSNYKWQDKGVVIKSDENCFYNCIDAAVCQDFNQNDVLLFGSFWGGLKMTELDKNGLCKNPKNLITVGDRRTDPNAIEGGFIFKKGKYFYLFESHDFCCRGTASSYHIVFGRSENIFGPYFDMFGKDLSQGGGTTLRDGFSFKRWAGPGHNSVFQDDDERTYLVYHAYDREDNGKSKLLIEELNWECDWPVLD